LELRFIKIKMINKEDFLKDTDENEIFGVIESFLNRLKENKTYEEVIILDKDKIEIIRDMLETYKNG